MTTVQLQLPDRQAAALQAQAEARGLTVEQYLRELLDRTGLSDAEETPVPSHARPIWEVIEEQLKDIPAEDFASLPKDGASQIDHYVYGSPKRDA